MKLCAFQNSHDAMRGCLHKEKSKHPKVMIDEELKRKRLENEIQELNEWIFELDKERKVVKANKIVVREKYFAAVRDAKSCLHKWHHERDKCREA